MTPKTNNKANFYQNHLLLGFYKKRGKALTIPHIVNFLDRLNNLPKDKPIRVLDVGCGKGDLLRLLAEISSVINSRRKIYFYGLERNPELIKDIVTLGVPEENLFCMDINDLLDQKFSHKFDLILSINTLHEVFSGYLGVGHKGFPINEYQKAQQKLEPIIKKLSSMLSVDGAFLIYDGLAPSLDKLEGKVKFKVKDLSTVNLLKKMSRENKIWKLQFINDAQNIFEMSYPDFLRFVSTMKYLDTKMWSIEQYENYFYYSEDEFESIFEKVGLKIESKILVNNDLNIWKKSVKLLENTTFPYKSILIMGSK